MARARLPHKGGGAEFGLDTMREQDEEDAAGGECKLVWLLGKDISLAFDVVTERESKYLSHHTLTC